MNSDSRTCLRCPVCGKAKADVTQRPGRRTPFFGCWSCSAAGLSGGDYLRAVAAEVGAKGGGDLLANLDRYLVPYALRPAPRTGGAGTGALPTAGQVAGMASRLLSEPEPLCWLADARGIDHRVAHDARVGWDGERLVFPMFRTDELVAAKWREPQDGAQMINCRGRGRSWPLYPSLPDSDWVLVVAGELDALCACSAGLPAVSVTLGAGHWRETWTEDLRGRRVVVCFDNGEGAIARRRVRELREAGIRTRRLDLRGLGLRNRKADLSDYLTHGGSVTTLRRTALRRRSS